jgi:hypothetical protein
LPLPPGPPEAVALPTTVGVTQAAVGISIATAAAAGPSSASDLQAMVLVLLARCSVKTVDAAAAQGGTAGGYEMLTPFALHDTAAGALAGNAAAAGCLALVQGAVYSFLRLARRQARAEAAAGARLPGLLLLFSISLHHSTVFASIRLLDGRDGAEVSAGVVGLLLSLAIPVAVAVAALRVPRRFVAYGAQDGSRFARPPLSLVVPVGVSLPDPTRLMLSSAVASFVSPSPLYPLMPFVSSLASNVPALLPPGTPAWLCAGSMFASAAVHVGLALAVVGLRMHRFPSGRVLGAAGFLVVGVFHLQLASGHRGGVDVTMAVQAGLSTLRGLVAVCVTVLESKMQSDPSVLRSKVLWMVGGGGATPPRDTPPLVPIAPIQGVSISDDAGDDDGSSALEMALIPSAAPPRPGAARGHEQDPFLSPEPEATDDTETDELLDAADVCSAAGEEVDWEHAAASWRQGTEMAAVLIGLPAVEEEDDLCRAYRRLGDPVPGPRPVVDDLFEL